jgi:hypothetical protein
MALIMVDNSNTQTTAIPSADLPQHRLEPETDPSKLPKPTLQPGTLMFVAGGFSSTETLWWNNGVWGRCGYAIPNAGGKYNSKNHIIRGLVQFIGRELFMLMHDDDVKFRRPPNIEWLSSVAKMITLGKKRIADRSVPFTEPRTGDADHVSSETASFLVFPIPYFGDRVRNDFAKQCANVMLIMLGEMMQHSDNDYDGDITDFLASKMIEQFRRIEYTIATMYLNIDRTAAKAPTFSLPAISATNYNPGALFTESEMIDERPGDFWWPSANDLTPINGISLPNAMAYALRWPVSGSDYYGDQGAHEGAFPGGSTGSAFIARPGSPV